MKAYMLFFALKHPKTPLLSKTSLILIVAYIVNPIDRIPDFIPFLGYLDDALLNPSWLGYSEKVDSQKDSGGVHMKSRRETER